MPESGADHDEIIRLKAAIENLDRTMHVLRAADEQARTLLHGADEQARMLAAESLGEKLDKVNEFRGALSDAQLTMMPRAEVRLLVEALDLRITTLADTTVAKMETIASTVATLGQTLVALRATLAGESAGATEQIAALGRSRNQMFAVIGVILVVVGLTVTLYFGFRDHNTTKQPSTPATTSAAAVVFEHPR